MNLEGVYISEKIDSAIEAFIKKLGPTQIAVIIDENTKKHCLPIFASAISLPYSVIEIKSGEEEKTLQTCTKIWQQLTDLNFDRRGLVINLGGGVIGDMGGFCAATYKRGIRFIQIPTTLLSMVDASVGGKLGVDFNSFKNHIGVFQIPEAVFICTEFLDTLSQREIRSGFAEIVKHHLIADGKGWESLKQKGFKEHNLKELVAHSVKIKHHVTTTDPTEKGLRKILNFGHTLGHAIETYLLLTPEKLLHGEAIAYGMISETYLAFKKGFLSKEDFNKINNYLLQEYGPLKLKKTQLDDIVSLTIQDKKNEGGVVKFSLLEEIGKANFNISISKEEMREVLVELFLFVN